MNILTLKKLKEMKPGIFATGIVSDNSVGVNMTNSGRLLRWVAVRGGMHDWKIYCHWAYNSEQWIKDRGDKIHDMNSVKKLVKASKKALEMYRH